MNGLLSNEEAECGLNPNSEDLGKFNRLFYFNFYMKDLDAEEDDG